MSGSESLTMEDFVAQVARALELPADLAGPDARALVLDLARDAAHGVARPAAPLTTFLAGVALGRAGAAPEDLRRTVAAITALIPPG